MVINHLYRSDMKLKAGKQSHKKGKERKRKYTGGKKKKKKKLHILKLAHTSMVSTTMARAPAT